MATISLPTPDNLMADGGICANEQCGHEDCQEARALAARVCILCKHSLGYETLLYWHPDEEAWTHLRCPLEK